MYRLLLLLHLTLLLLPNVLWVAVAEDVSDALMRGIPPSLVFLAVLVAWSRQPRWVLLALLPFYVLLPFEAYYLLTYGQPSSAHVLAVVAETNFSETLQYLGAGPLLLGAGAATPLLLVTLHLAWHAAPLPRHRLLTWLAFATLVPLLQYAWLEVDWALTRPSGFADVDATSGENIQPMTDVPTPMGVTLSDSYPLGVFFRIRDFLGERERIKQASDRIRIHDFQVRTAQLPDQPETYVLVVGESARPDHWGLNGYGRDTTPRLALKDRLVSFRNAVSPWPATRLAVPVILVGQQTSSHRAVPGKASIVSLFKQAGFRTYWLSNQAPLGFHDSIISVHAQEADEVVFTNPTDHTKQGKDDGVLLPVFQRLLKQSAPKKLFVVHTMGSHKRYDQRYPPEFNRFEPADLGKLVADPPEAVVNSYDNSILFTDHVLAELIAALERTGPAHSALMYLSDHGQTLPLSGCQLDGHGRRNEADFRVAALLWVAEAIDRAKPHVLQQAGKRRDAPLESVGAFHALAELADLSFPDWQPARSWISTAWQPRTRWTNAVPDFDNAFREPPCGKLKMP